MGADTLLEERNEVLLSLSLREIHLELGEWGNSLKTRSALMESITSIKSINEMKTRDCSERKRRRKSTFSSWGLTEEPSSRAIRAALNVIRTNWGLFMPSDIHRALHKDFLPLTPLKVSKSCFLLVYLFI